MDSELSRSSFLKTLSRLSALYGQTVSESALTESLIERDSDDGTFLYVASRAMLDLGFRVKVVHRSLKSFPVVSLPAAIVMKDGSSCILLSVTIDKSKAKKNQRLYHVSYSGKEEDEYIVEEELMCAQYAGIGVLFRPVHGDCESEENSSLKGHWFWGGFRRLLPYYFEAILATGVINIIALVSSFFAMNVYDRIVPNEAIESLWVLSLGAMIAFFFEFLLKTLRGYVLDSAGKKADLKISSNIFRYIMGLKSSSNLSSTGAVSSQIRDFDVVREFFSSVSLVCLADLPFAIFFILVISQIGGVISAVPLAAVVIGILVCFIVQIPISRVNQKILMQSSHKQGVFVEALTKFSSVRASRSISMFRSRWERACFILSKSSNIYKFLNLFSMNFNAFLQQLVNVFVIIIGVYLITSNRMTMGALIACSILSSRSISMLGQLNMLLVKYHQTKLSYNAMSNIMQMSSEREKGKSYLIDYQISGDVLLKDVKVLRQDRPLPVLNIKNLHIKAGEKVAILGSLGSGKTSLLNIISGMEEASEGSIMIDNLDIGQLDPADLRAQTGYLIQRQSLLSGSLFENLTSGERGEIEDKDIVDIINDLGMQGLVFEHPKGLNQSFSEFNMGASVGQQQLILIAALFLKPRPIMLLDEPTSALDHNSEDRVIKTLERISKSSTLIISTHRPAILKLVDRVIVMNKGEIALDGEKDKVLKMLASSEAV